MAEMNSATAGGSGAEQSVGFRWSIQQSFNPHLHVSTDTPRRLREDLHQVIRGLSPFVERSPTVTLSNLLRNTQSQNPFFSSVNAAGAQHQRAQRASNDRSEFVIDVDGSSDGVDDVVGPNAAADNNNVPSGSSDQSASDVLRHSAELRTLVSVAEKYLPFLFILLGKLIFDHKTGILVLIGLVVTFVHANAVIKREVGKQSKRHLGSLLAVSINLLTCIFFIYYVFETDKLYYSLACMLPVRSDPLTFWDLLWIVGITDFVLKLITILIKVVIVILPSQLTAYQKKGKYYLFIEQTSQLYRTFVPIQPWIWYLLEAYEGNTKLFGLLLSAIYIISKGKDVFKKMKLWKISLSKLMQSVSYGSKPSKEQIEIMGGNTCPICQDDFRHPTMLQCKHIFCEECVVMWFDRERTCPMCRAQIADDPTWRDGATTFFFQLF